MAHRSSPPPSTARTELKALALCLLPMPEDDERLFVAKVVAGLLVTVWCTITLALTFGVFEASAPPYWWLFTALVFTLVGKLWDFEAGKLLSSK